MGNSCTSCQQPIDWNQTVREKLNTRRPLNPDGTIHSCNGGGRTFRGKAIEPSNGSNPPSAVTKEAIAIKQEQTITIEELTESFQTLVKNMTQYLRNEANK
jgi:hypothetical protein